MVRVGSANRHASRVMYHTIFLCSVCFGHFGWALYFPTQVQIISPEHSFEVTPKGMWNTRSVLSAGMRLEYPIPASVVSTLLVDQLSSYQKDKVVRVLDANTVKLERLGVAAIAGSRTPNPSNGKFQYPECFGNSPSYKIKQLLPNGTEVLVKKLSASDSSARNAVPPVILVRKEDKLVVHEELIKSGYAKAVQSKNLGQTMDLPALQVMEATAKEKGLGIFRRCDEQLAESETFVAPVAQFEPLLNAQDVVLGNENGAPVYRLRNKKGADDNPLQNPGDTKGCSDFLTYKDALKWFETYQPVYGDVANLDRNGDGIPCPGLPHTSNRDQYRMKIPSTLKPP